MRMVKMSKRRISTRSQPALAFPSTPRSRPTRTDNKAPGFASRAIAPTGASDPAPDASVNIPPSQAIPVRDRPMDASFDLPDSTDWIKTSLPAFEPLEAALRCEVCKEFYNNPVITSCNHTFCSICIRRCITTDGKCPSCKKGCSSDKLAPNIAVREVVMRFQEARPKALELARADKEQEATAGSKNKRKLDDTDIEEGESIRHTRSRQTRSKSQHNGGADGTSSVIVNSEDDGDDDFVPDGMVKCPMCNKAMKEAVVFNHLDTCTGPDASQGRNTRSRYVRDMTSRR
jgi:E3 ubiquitin-protein ligase RAD18